MNGTGDRGRIWTVVKVPACRQAGEGSVAMVADAEERAKGEVALGGGGTDPVRLAGIDRKNLLSGYATCVAYCL